MIEFAKIISLSIRLLALELMLVLGACSCQTEMSTYELLHYAPKIPGWKNPPAAPKAAGIFGNRRAPLARPALAPKAPSASIPSARPASAPKAPPASIPSARPLVGIFVNPSSTETPASGKSWVSGFKSIVAAINAAGESGQAIYVAAGTYFESIDLTNKKNIHLVGGYTPADTHEKDRKTLPVGEWTILDGSTIAGPNLVKISGDASDITFDGGFIFQNVTDGSAIEIRGNDSANKIKGITISGCQFLNNKDMRPQSWFGRGAGISIYNGEKIKLNNLYASKNKVSHLGGFIAAENVFDVTISGGIWEKNSTKGHGGALFLSYSSKVKISKSILRNNKSQNRGGGAYIFSCRAKKISLSHMEFIGNSSTNDSGGGLNVSQSAIIKLSDLTFDTNKAYLSGGGLSVELSDVVKIENSKFIKNEARIHGRDMRLGVLKNLAQLSNNTFDGAQAGLDNSVTIY